MNSSEIRSRFLSFFEGKGHTVMPSSPLVPHGDPTLLLTSAGMVQMKPFFMGEATPPNRRLASCQKCFRTTDIDCVGDAGHLTFFEMLGNFSVGDYFKKETIEWAWEFVTRHLGLPKDRLWITVFLDDHEAEQYWLNLGVPKERIVRCGEEDNFWGPAGESGPCGPCSEIHYDFGEGIGCGGPDCGPACHCDRFSEIWNLVFTEFDQDIDGRRTPLKQKNIDTGMGLERTAALMQGRTSVYETDLFAPIMARIAELSGQKYGQSADTDRAMRVVAEHGRALTFLIGDGVIPSNEGRGYVLRRVLRRAALFGRKLGLNEAFLSKIGAAVIDRMGDVYPELSTIREHILKVIDIEENRFDQTLAVGMDVLDEIIARLKGQGQNVIPGNEIFRLYDTYGFPREITAEIASESGMVLDEDGFEREMEAQRERAREAARFGLADRSAEMFYETLSLPPTRFVGYDKLSAQARVVALISNGASVDSVSAGEEVEVILEETPFYGEKGGQVGDTGEIISARGRVAVRDAHHPTDRLTSHVGVVDEGTITVGDQATARVDSERRLDIARNHTATHLLHAALRQVLGEQVRQGGSLVAPDHFRFDFTHLVALSDSELMQVQHLVNENIRRNLTVSSRNLPYQEALNQGALAFFGEKYGDEVRVVRISDAVSSDIVSAELCGGTHLNHTGQIGYLHVTSERSIGSGLRRIEAVTGREAERLIEERLSTVDRIAHQLETSPSEVSERVAALIEELSSEHKRARELEAQLLRKTAEELLPQAVQVNGVNVLSAQVPASSMDLMRQTGDWLRDKLGSAVIVLGANLEGNPRFLAMVTRDLTEQGVHAGTIVKQVAQVAGGGGGGRPEMAQAGGKDSSKLGEALALVPKLVRQK